MPFLSFFFFFCLAVRESVQNVTAPFTEAFHLAFLRHAGKHGESEKISLLLSKDVNDKNTNVQTLTSSQLHTLNRHNKEVRSFGHSSKRNNDKQTTQK